MAVKSVFDIKCFKDVKFWIEQSVLHYNQFYIIIYRNPKTFFKISFPPCVPAKALACICVTVFYTLYGSGLLAHGGGMFSSPKTRGLSP